MCICTKSSEHWKPVWNVCPWHSSLCVCMCACICVYLRAHTWSKRVSEARMGCHVVGITYIFFMLPIHFALVFSIVRQAENLVGLHCKLGPRKVQCDTKVFLVKIPGSLQSMLTCRDLLRMILEGWYRLEDIWITHGKHAACNCRTSDRTPRLRPGCDESDSGIYRNGQANRENKFNFRWRLSRCFQNRYYRYWFTISWSIFLDCLGLIPVSWDFTTQTPIHATTIQVKSATYVL